MLVLSITYMVNSAHDCQRANASVRQIGATTSAACRLFVEVKNVTANTLRVNRSSEISAAIGE